MTEEARLGKSGQAGTISLLSLIGHVDLPYRLKYRIFASNANTSAYRWKPQRAISTMCVPKPEGLMRLSCPFSFHYVTGHRAKLLTDSLINMVRSIAEAHPDKFAVYPSAEASGRCQFSKGLISLPMGMENGAPLKETPECGIFTNVASGYITLTHSKDNHLVILPTIPPTPECNLSRAGGGPK